MKKPFWISKTAFLSVFFAIFIGFSSPLKAQEKDTESEKINMGDIIIHHVMDDHQWHFTDHLILPLPIIVYSSERGLSVFSSSNFFNEHHQEVEYNGYKL